MCKSAEETAEAGKARQQELAEEVSALGAELSQAREQVASMDFLLTEKEVDVANKEKELAVRAAEITRKQELHRKRRRLKTCNLYKSKSRS